MREVSKVVTPLILDVNPDPRALEWEQDFLTRIENPVIGCCGPDAQGGCPLLSGEPCGKIEGADGVIVQLDIDRPDHRRILTKYVELLRVPIRVVVTEEQRHRWSDLLESVEVFVPPIGPAKLDGFAAEVAAETATM